jgi:uncharacterized membrane protein YkvA (DUF1232 family)
LIEKLKSRAEALKRDVYALSIAVRDPRVPWYAKVLMGLVLAYAFSPIDLIPDFIPVLGYLDDLIVIPLGIALALKMIPAQVMVDARQKVDDSLRQGEPASRAGAILVILIWLIFLVLVIWLIGRVVTKTPTSALP